jgi:hypothetical protein
MNILGIYLQRQLKTYFLFVLCLTAFSCTQKEQEKEIDDEDEGLTEVEEDCNFLHIPEKCWIPEPQEISLDISPD